MQFAGHIWMQIDIPPEIKVAIGNRPLDPEQFLHRNVALLVSDVTTPDGEPDLGDILSITRKAPGIA